MNRDWQDVRPWVEATLGPLVEETRLSAGNSRTSWKVAAAFSEERAHQYVVRYEPGTGPLSGTSIDLRREQVVYEALSSQDVRIPAFKAANADGDALIVDWVAGSDRWDPALLPAYLEELARLHVVDVEQLDLPGFARDSLAEVDLWWKVHLAKSSEPSPFVELACEMLRAHHPGEPATSVMCHGDAGPGNFLHEGGRVTALLDWEFAHVGDPHDDLAWVTVRAWMFGVDLPDFGAAVENHYARNSPDFDLDPSRLAYWQAMVMLRNLVIVLSAIENGEPGRGRFVHLGLRPSLQWAVLVAVAKVAGITPPVHRASIDPLSRPAADVMSELSRGLDELLPSLAHDLDAARRVKLMNRLLAQLAETWGHPDVVPADKVPGDCLEQRFAALTQMARAELVLFPRAMRMVATPLATGGADNPTKETSLHDLDAER